MQAVLESPHQRVYFKDRDSRILWASNGFLVDLGSGLTLEEVIGKTDFDFFEASHAQDAFSDEQRIVLTGEPLIGRVEHKNGDAEEGEAQVWVSTTKEPLYDADGNIIGTWGMSRDISVQIEAQQALAEQALRDTVTGLPNRLALMDRLTQALLSLDRHTGRVALLFVDLDGFKDINDTLGHGAGDLALIEVASRLREIARRSDTVARLGGDEFVVLCTELGDSEDLRLVGERIVMALREPFEVEGQEIYLTGSVGAIATSDSHYSAADLMRQADVAMYGAKRGGRNRFQVYDASVQPPTKSSNSLVADLRLALTNSELTVAYQPLFRLSDGEIIGAEALVRWTHPQRGNIPPDEFIHLAEQRGMIGEIDEFVLNEACRQLAQWREQEEGAWDDFVLSVNVSGHDLSDPALVERVERALKKHGVRAQQLCLEITETAMISELEHAKEIVKQLAALGVHLALDDFGTGYSTLVHLQQFRTDTLKIDRSFVSKLDDNSRERKIIATVIAMAHTLGMTVVGEGIETDCQRESLEGLECDNGQGFVFSPPLTASAFAAQRRLQ